jgi:hypothetical protein
MSPRELRHASECAELHPNQTIFLTVGALRLNFPQKLKPSRPLQTIVSPRFETMIRSRERWRDIKKVKPD